MAQVICKFCGKSFDRTKEPAVEVSARRYAHKKCYEKYLASLSEAEKKRIKEEQDYKQLEAYIMHLFNENFVNAKIRKQIKDFRKDYNYTYSGILKTLEWWFGIKRNSIEDANNGIGIVPYIYQDACNYFYSLYVSDILNSEMGKYTEKEETIRIKTPKPTPYQKRDFNIDEVDDD